VTNFKLIQHGNNQLITFHMIMKDINIVDHTVTYRLLDSDSARFRHKPWGKQTKTVVLGNCHL